MPFVALHPFNQEVLPGITQACQLGTQYSTTALSSMTLQTGAMDLVISALDATGKTYQQFSLPNAIQIANATNIQSVQPTLPWWKRILPL